MSLYGYGTFIITICAIAFLGFILGYAYEYIAAIGYKVSIDLGTADSEVEFVKNSFSFVATYIVIAMLIVLVYWLLVHSQKKGVQIYGEA